MLSLDYEKAKKRVNHSTVSNTVIVCEQSSFSISFT